MRIAFVLLTAHIGTFVVCAQQPEKVEAKTVQAKLNGIWQERSADPKAMKYDKTWEIFTHAPGRARWTDHDNESQQRDHQVHLNVEAIPCGSTSDSGENAREWWWSAFSRSAATKSTGRAGSGWMGQSTTRPKVPWPGARKDFSTKEGHSVVLDRIKP